MTNEHSTSSGFLSPHAVGLLLVTAAATLWSFAGVAVKLLPGLDPLAITGWRSLFALPVVVAVWRLRGISPEPGTGGYVAGSAVSYAMMVMLFISATRMTTAANAIVLQYTAPLWVAVFSRAVLGETVSRREWLMMSACLAGMGFFFLDKLSFAGRIGNGLAIVSGIACGLNTLFLRRLSRQGDPIRTMREPGRRCPHGAVQADPSAGPERAADTGWNGIPALVMGNLLVIVFSAGSMMRGLPVGAVEWGVLAALGVFQLSVPYVLFLVGIRTVTAVESMLFAMLEAILNPLWVGFGAGEWPSPGAIVGAGLILSSMAAYGIARANGRSRERQQ